MRATASRARFAWSLSGSGSIAAGPQDMALPALRLPGGVPVSVLPEDGHAHHARRSGVLLWFVGHSGPLVGLGTTQGFAWVGPCHAGATPTALGRAVSPAGKHGQGSPQFPHRPLRQGRSRARTGRCCRESIGLPSRLASVGGRGRLDALRKDSRSARRIPRDMTDRPQASISHVP